MTEELGDSREQGRRRLDGLHWIRFSGYELRDGLLRPSPGASIEAYDPWAADRQAQNPTERPYRRLLRLIQRIDPTTRKLSVQQWKQLSGWLCENGLLGILPHELLEFTTGPVWRETPLEITPSRVKGVKLLAPHQRRVSWGPRGWQTAVFKVGPEQPLRTAKPGEPVRDPRYLNSFCVPHESLLRSWPNGTLERRPLDESLGAYFLGSDYYADARRDYPSPATTDFWANYGEPLSAFVQLARFLGECISALEGWGASDDSAALDASRGLEYLNRAASPTSLALGAAQPTDKLRLLWSSPSLFGSFAVMILEDLAGGQRVMRCPVCGGVFLASAHQTRFCSSTCRYTHHKREQRRAQREAKDKSEDEK